MINLMYIVLTAMLALNVSSDVLGGFTEVGDSVKRSTDASSLRNDELINALGASASRNSAKGGDWYSKAQVVKMNADSLCETLESLKHEIAVKADGEDADTYRLRSGENLDAASTVMLSPIGKKGKKVKDDVDQFRAMLEDMTADPTHRSRFATLLSTQPRMNGEGVVQSWEEQRFENMPAIAAITLLSQLQNDIRLAEGEILTELLNSIDAGDTRVNEMKALVIPKSQIVMRGGEYTAEIVMAAVDSTCRPQITVNDKELAPGESIYRVTTAGSGEMTYGGYITLSQPDGSKSQFPFDGSYTVIDPMATVSSTMTNVLYCGIENPISISVPGVAQTHVSATMTNGSIRKIGNNWVATPASTETDAEITVTADIDGTSHKMMTQRLKVRRLPDPKGFIVYKDVTGQPKEYHGGVPLAKSAFLTSDGLAASIDDGILDIAFEVTGFETVFFDSMGNAIPEMSNGANFSQRQKDAFKRLGRGKRVYITKIKAKGPDGTERSLSPIEVILQ